MPRRLLPRVRRGGPDAGTGRPHPGQRVGQLVTRWTPLPDPRWHPDLLPPQPDRRRRRVPTGGCTHRQPKPADPTSAERQHLALAAVAGRGLWGRTSQLQPALRHRSSGSGSLRGRRPVLGDPVPALRQPRGCPRRLDPRTDDRGPARGGDGRSGDSRSGPTLDSGVLRGGRSRSPGSDPGFVPPVLTRPQGTGFPPVRVRSGDFGPHRKHFLGQGSADQDQAAVGVIE